MQKTVYYDLPIYEPNDSASLIDGYNKAVLALDAALHALQNNVDLLEMRLKNLEFNKEN